MVTDIEAKRADFRALHSEGYFLLPSAYDATGARRLARLGFAALASNYEHPAQTISNDAALSRLLTQTRELVSATELPLTVDFATGFAERPECVAENATHLIDTGVAGLTIGDTKADTVDDMVISIVRVAMIRAAISAAKANVVLTARSCSHLVHPTDVDQTIKRLTAYSRAGADVLQAPGITDAKHIKEIVNAVSPKAVDVSLIDPDMRVMDIGVLGVRRISLGTTAATAARNDEIAKGLLDEGHLPAA